MPRPFVICYICGREFGSASIAIHEPQCMKKWTQQNELRPREERLPPPIKPEAFLQPSTSGPSGFSGGATEGQDGQPTQKANTFNEAAAMAASANLAPCPLCGRTFNGDRLAAHKKVCKPKLNQRNANGSYWGNVSRSNSSNGIDGPDLEDNDAELQETRKYCTWENCRDPGPTHDSFSKMRGWLSRWMCTG